MRRSAAFLVYLSIFLGEVVWNGFVPLVPQLAQRYSMTKLDAGVLLAITSAAIVVVSLPAASVCERFGPRRMTVLATAVMAAASLWQGLATSFAGLAGARALFGIGFGIIWISGLRWLSELAGPREGQALSLTVTTAGASAVVGPSVTAVLVSRLGMGWPFAAIAGVTGLLAVAMWLEPSRTGAATGEHQPIREMLDGIADDRLVGVSLLVMATAGLLAAAINLLVPLQLHRNGVSTSWIGIAFGVSAIVFICFSAAVARSVDRFTSIRAVAVGMVAAVVVTVIPLVSESTPGLVGYLMARAPLTAFLFTVAFPLGAIGARRAGITVGAVAGLINVSWSLAMLIGPLLFAGVAQAAGNRAAYLLLMALFCCSIGWMLLPRGRSAAAPAPGRGR